MGWLIIAGKVEVRLWGGCGLSESIMGCMVEYVWCVG